MIKKGVSMILIMLLVSIGFLTISKQMQKVSFLNKIEETAEELVKPTINNTQISINDNDYAFEYIDAKIDSYDRKYYKHFTSKYEASSIIEMIISYNVYDGEAAKEHLIGE